MSSSSTPLERLIPGIRWARNHSTEHALLDAIAGVTVGLTVLPQALAYATLAGLQPQYGLYSAFVGCIVYAFFGGCADLTIGPTALLALMTGRHTGLGGESGPHLAILLCFLSGVVEMIMAFLKLGVLVDLISLPVSVGFTSATALIIASSQLKGLLGLQSDSATDFISTILSFFRNLQSTRIGDATLGISSVIILLLFRKLKDIKAPENAKKSRCIFHTTFWLIATARNALIVLVASVIAFYCERSGTSPFILTGTVRSGIPYIQLPPSHTTILNSNGTIVELNFGGMLGEFMIEYEVVKPLWRCNKREVLPGAVTFILSLIVSVEIGLLGGVLTDIAFVVQRTARPGLSINKANTVSNIQYVLVRPKHSLLYFPAVEWVRNGISNAVKQYGNLPVVLDCRNLNEFDFTVVRGLEALHKELASMKVPLILLGTQDAVKTILIGATNVSIPDASNEHELDEMLQEITSEGNKDLKEVFTPLLRSSNQDQLEVL